MRFDKKFWATTFTLTGTIIGAGVLGLPYVFMKSGFLTGLFWLFFLGVIILYSFLCLGEVALRTKKTLQLPGYAEKYLGKKGRILMFIAVIFGVYSALLAYLIGEGQSFSFLFTGVESYAIYYALGFWFIMTLFLREGLRGLKKFETWGVLAIIFIVLAIIIWYSTNINYENISLYKSNSNFFLPFGVVLFALLGFTSVPEMEMEIKGQEKKMKKAIILGVLIPVIIYIIFPFIFVGVLGDKVPEVATIGLGRLVVLLGIFTMMTSYFVLSFSLKDVYALDFSFSKRWNFILVSLIPVVVYLILYYLDMLSFVDVLGIGGVVSGGLTGILILVMAIRAKKLGDRKPEYSMPINWFIIAFLSLIYVAGVVIELVF